MLGTVYFLKIAKINSQQEKTICPDRKISSRKMQNKKRMPMRKNKLSQKFSATCHGK